MKRTNSLLVAAMTGLMATTSLGAIAVSAGTTTPATETKAPEKAQYATQKQLLKTADEALATLANVRQARLALLDNKIDVAKTHVADATKALAEGEDEFKALRVADTETADAKPDFLPFDMSISLSESFEATTDNQAALEKANVLMQAGDKDAAIDVLRVASIDVNISAALLPEKSSMDHLKQAADLIDKKEYFSANLALKEIEDSVLVRNFGINAIPVQGSASHTDETASAQKDAG